MKSKPVARAAFRVDRRALLAYTGLIFASVTKAAQFTQNTDAVIFWNEAARNIVSRLNIDPPMASRLLAYLSIAQFHALSSLSFCEKILSEQVVDEASAVTLQKLLPSGFAEIAGFYETVQMERMREPAYAVVDAGRMLGRRAAEAALKRAEIDGATAVDDDVAPPTGPMFWRSEQGRRPVRPNWGLVRPLTLDEVNDWLPPPPPEYGSSEFVTAVEHVRILSRQPSPKAMESVYLWADGIGTSTPAGHWNHIAVEIIRQQNLGEQEATRTLALLNIALFDASIVCWKTKYTHWLARPSQIEPAIKPHLVNPNFPAYTSGHATFSGAAATVLGQLFPDRAAALWRLADEAARSRVYAGIHYQFDSTAGLDTGRRVGSRVLNVATEDSGFLTQLGMDERVSQSGLDAECP